MSDPPSEVCVTCGKGPVEKILFPVAVHFKGSGFYSTDYGKGKKKAKDTDGDSAALKDKAADKPAEKTASEPKPKPSADAS
ncbi:MAG: putative regulatory protein, FmdB [Thermoleophilia bacterium]|nr:putative regulatory protein, FmdB [Thermoleophilia bacterium]